MLNSRQTKLALVAAILNLLLFTIRVKAAIGISFIVGALTGALAVWLF